MTHPAPISMPPDTAPDAPATPTTQQTQQTLLVLSCEHGGNRIPAPYRALFAGASALLRSHRGYDPGALRMARDFAAAFAAPLQAAVTSRLLIDLNRSVGHPRLYSEFTRPLPAAQRRQILQQHYLPYRTALEARIGAACARGLRVLHLSCHSFTPELDGQVRRADIGLLYDPARPAEAGLCRAWRTALGQRDPALVVRMNYPYAGNADGLTTHLRRVLPAQAYLGIELEINQKLVRCGATGWQRLRRHLIEALAAAGGLSIVIAPGR